MTYGYDEPTPAWAGKDGGNHPQGDGDLRAVLDKAYRGGTGICVYCNRQYAHAEECLVPVLESARERLERYRLLADAVNDSENDCTDECTSFGHREGCKTYDAAAMLVTARQSLEAAERRARMMKAEVEVYRTSLAAIRDASIEETLEEMAAEGLRAGEEAAALAAQDTNDRAQAEKQGQ